MLNSIATSTANPANSRFVGTDGSLQNPALAPGAMPTDTISDADIKQICRSSSVSLDASAVSNLQAYKDYDTVTQASLTALSETLRLHNDLLKQLGQ